MRSFSRVTSPLWTYSSLLMKRTICSLCSIINAQAPGMTRKTTGRQAVTFHATTLVAGRDKNGFKLCSRRGACSQEPKTTLGKGLSTTPGFGNHRRFQRSLDYINNGDPRSVLNISFLFPSTYKFDLTHTNFPKKSYSKPSFTNILSIPKRIPTNTTV